MSGRSTYNRPPRCSDKPNHLSVAAIDRLVHHATILEMNGDSYRRRAAAGRRPAKHDPRPTTSSDNFDPDTSDNITEDTAE